MPVRKSLKNHLLPTSPVKILDRKEAASMKQGIVAILRSDCEGTNNNKAANSIRRTLSADMSSKKWLQQNGFFVSSSPIKKIVSSSEMLLLPSASAAPDSSSSSEEGEEEYDENPAQDDVWRSIQAQKEMIQKPQMDVWGSLILTHQKSENSASLPPPPPYVHPLVKRSSSTLSEKSLEICTESLGSETGCDGFCSYCPPSEINLSDADEVNKEDRRQTIAAEEIKDLHVAKYKKAPLRPLPPPLSSIAGSGDGAALHMHSHRENGRLVLQAVSVPPRNYFRAQRGDGRLVLTLIQTPPNFEDNKVEEFEKVFDNMEEFDDEEGEKVDDGGGEEDKVAAAAAAAAEEEEEENFQLAKSARMEKEFVVEEQNLSLPSGMISVHKTGLVMKKLMAVGNMNPATWTNKLINKASSETEAGAEEGIPIPHLLPPPPRVGARLIPSPPASSFNAYEYFWRNKTTACGGFINPIATAPQPTHLKNKNTKENGRKPYEHQGLVLMKGNKTGHSVPYLRGCKDPRRSLLLWEPYCIATS